MASFSGEIGTPSKGFTLKVEYEYSQSIENNNSIISSIKGYCKKNNSTYYPYNTNKIATIKIERLDDEDNWITVTTLSDSSSYSFNGVSTSTYLEFVSGENIAIPHKSDGSQQLRITFNVDGKLSNYYPIGSISSSPELTTIPRASEPTLSASSVAMGSSVTITTNRKSDSFTHTIKYGFGDTSGTIATGVETSVKWTPALDLAKQIPNTTSGICTITCDTYKGNELVGSKTVTLTLTVPSSIVPSISSINLSEENSIIPSEWGVYVQGKSQLNVEINTSGSYGSSITSCKVTGIDNNTYWSTSFTSGKLQIAGTRTITVTVTDSRGRTTTKTTTYTCVAYSNPSISAATVTRCNEDGTINQKGTFVKYTFKASISSINSKNTKSFKLGYKLTKDSSYTYIDIVSDSYSLEKTDVILTGLTFSNGSSYDFQFLATDYFTSTPITRSIGTGFKLINFNKSGKGMGIGKVSEKDALEIAMDTEITGDLDILGDVTINNENISNYMNFKRYATNVGRDFQVYLGKCEKYPSDSIYNKGSLTLFVSNLDIYDWNCPGIINWFKDTGAKFTLFDEIRYTDYKKYLRVWDDGTYLYLFLGGGAYHNNWNVDILSSRGFSDMTGAVLSQAEYNEFVKDMTYVADYNPVDNADKKELIYSTSPTEMKAGDSLSLLDNVENYKEVEIICYRGTDYGSSSVKFSPSSNKTPTLILTYTDDTRIIQLVAKFQLSGSTLTCISSNSYTTNSSGVTISSGNTFLLTKVIGYK